MGSWLEARPRAAGTVLARAGVDGKTNEITRFAPLLEPLDLAGCVITVDALHTQRKHAEFLVTKQNAHYRLRDHPAWDARQAAPAQLAAWIRGHRHIEVPHHSRAA